MMYFLRSLCPCLNIYNVVEWLAPQMPKDDISSFVRRCQQPAHAQVYLQTLKRTRTHREHLTICCHVQIIATN